MADKHDVSYRRAVQNIRLDSNMNINGYPEQVRLMQRVHAMRQDWPDGEKVRTANYATAEALVVVIDKLDRIIELLEGDAHERA